MARANPFPPTACGSGTRGTIPPGPRLGRAGLRRLGLAYGEGAGFGAASAVRAMVAAVSGVGAGGREDHPGHGPAGRGAGNLLERRQGRYPGIPRLRSVSALRDRVAHRPAREAMPSTRSNSATTAYLPVASPPCGLGSIPGIAFPASRKSAGEIAEAAKAWGQNDDITVVTVRRTA